MKQRTLHTLSLACVLAGLSACAQPTESASVTSSEALEESPAETAQDQAESMSTPETPSSDAAAPETATEVATLGAGCFWCVEAVLEQIDGVQSVTSGYMGGSVAKPSYKAVCTGNTGHAEVVQVTFDPAVLPYSELLDWFWRLHNPTTLNQQGADIGTQYRSAIFVHSAAQRETAEASLAAADASGVFDAPIVTEITEAETYWPAEGYHQDYYSQNKSQGYCQMVIRPKLKKLGLEE